MSYSTQKITSSLIEELKKALHKVRYGSIEIFVQDNVVTQITVRNIKKTSYKLTSSERENVNSNPILKVKNAQRTHITGAISASKIRVLTIKKD